jgi:hypothetical protein
MASRASQVLVKAFEIEIAVSVIEPGHAVQTIMAINTSIAEIRNMLQNKISVIRSVAALA